MSRVSHAPAAHPDQTHYPCTSLSLRSLCTRRSVSPSSSPSSSWRWPFLPFGRARLPGTAPDPPGCTGAYRRLAVRISPHGGISFPPGEVNKPPSMGARGLSGALTGMPCPPGDAAPWLSLPQASYPAALQLRVTPHLRRPGDGPGACARGVSRVPVTLLELLCCKYVEWRKFSRTGRRKNGLLSCRKSTKKKRTTPLHGCPGISMSQ